MEPTPSAQTHYVFRLYNTDRSVEMQEVAKRIQELVLATFGGECRVDMVDVLESPERAVQAGVFLTPTLVRELPEPVRRVMGDLHDPDKSLALLGILTVQKEDTSPR